MITCLHRTTASPDDVWQSTTVSNGLPVPPNHHCRYSNFIYLPISMLCMASKQIYRFCAKTKKLKELPENHYQPLAILFLRDSLLTEWLEWDRSCKKLCFCGVISKYVK